MVSLQQMPSPEWAAAIARKRVVLCPVVLCPAVHNDLLQRCFGRDYPSTTGKVRGAKRFTGSWRCRASRRRHPTYDSEPVFRLVGELFTGRHGLPPGCSREHAVDGDVDCETKPLGAIAGDHRRGVGGQEREPVGL